MSSASIQRCLSLLGKSPTYCGVPPYAKPWPRDRCAVMSLPIAARGRCAAPEQILNQFGCPIEASSPTGWGPSFTFNQVSAASEAPTSLRRPADSSSGSRPSAVAAFSPFAPADVSTTRRFGGTACRPIVKPCRSACVARSECATHWVVGTSSVELDFGWPHSPESLDLQPIQALPATIPTAWRARAGVDDSDINLECQRFLNWRAHRFSLGRNGEAMKFCGLSRRLRFGADGCADSRHRRQRGPRVAFAASSGCAFADPGADAGALTR